MIERFHIPSSRAPRWLRISVYDAAAATLTPAAALLVHHLALSRAALPAELMALYAAVSVAAAFAAVAICRLGDGLSRYFALSDALLAGKAVLVAGVSAALGLLLLDRLHVMPGSLLTIHVTMLALALLAGRAVSRLSQRRRMPLRHVGRRNVIVVGCNRLADAYIGIVEAMPDHGLNIAALIDPAAKLVGRTIRGYPIAGSLESLASLVDEYKVHGVDIDRVMVAVPRGELSPIDLAILTAECARAGLEPEFLDSQLGLQPRASAQTDTARPMPLPELAVARDSSEASARHAIAPGAYHTVKRGFDFTVALLLAVATLPAIVAVAILVFVDVGAPVLFWQRRVGRRGRRFMVYKFRTFHAPYDRFGNPRLERAELSRIGQWLRRTRLDELPQLYNVLIGEMSIVGPRPLLDVDLPDNDERRLAVRPGLTGWAQVNGGKLLTVDDKNLLDCWYIANASPLLDAKILLRTVGMMLFGERDNPQALVTARAALAEPPAVVRSAHSDAALSAAA